jgi:hypothetical protein
MSLFTWLADFRPVTRELKRIADALDRAYPLPVAATTEPADERDVSYSSDEESMRQQLLEEAARKGFRFDSAGNLIEGPPEPEEDHVEFT